MLCKQSRACESSRVSGLQEPKKDNEPEDKERKRNITANCFIQHTYQIS